MYTSKFGIHFKGFANKLKVSLFFVATFLVVGFANANQFEAEAMPGEFLVQLKNGVSSKNKSFLLQTLGGRVIGSIPERNILVVRRPAVELRNYALTSLKKNPLVKIVEPNFIYRATRTPDDAELGKLWGMINTGQSDGENEGLAGVDINAEKAWDISTGSEKFIRHVS